MKGEALFGKIKSVFSREFPKWWPETEAKFLDFTLNETKKELEIQNRSRVSSYSSEYAKEELGLVIKALQSDSQFIRFHGYNLRENSTVWHTYTGDKPITAEYYHNLCKTNKAEGRRLKQGLMSKQIIEEHFSNSPNETQQVSKRTINTQVDPEVYAALKSINASTGLNMDYLIHKALALLFVESEQPVPAALVQKIADPTPRRSGPRPGTGGRPPKNKTLGD